MDHKNKVNDTQALSDGIDEAHNSTASSIKYNFEFIRFEARSQGILRLRSTHNGEGRGREGEATPKNLALLRGPLNFKWPFGA